MTDVLVVGAGPVGLTAASELRRHGVDCRIVERLVEPLRYAKAVGIQPRTLEVWEDMGIVQTMLDATTPFEGQIVFVNGAEVARMSVELPPDVPYGFVSVPQYETERLLSLHLEALGGTVERSVELQGLEQDEEGVTAMLAGPAGDEAVRCRYVVGCDGAHSAVRKALGISFEGDRFAEEYMLGDVEVDWSMPHTYAIRAMHRAEEEAIDDLLVCIPLPGRGRYRMSMLVPAELAGSDADHGLARDRPAPTLEHIQPVLDRLAPEPTVARSLRWSSVFRISHRLAGRYSDGRAFLCGDAAHIHPPTGAQGMNTGIQDAYNLAWKLGLAVRGIAAPGLVDSYHAERHPVGEEVVGRTVKHAREQGLEADPDDPSTVLRREAQLLVGYPDSPLVGEEGAFDGGPRAGERAPDATGLRRPGASFELRLFQLLAGPEHVLFLTSDGGQPQHLEATANAARERARGLLRVYAVLGPDTDAAGLDLPCVRDQQESFRAAYGTNGGCAVLVRPDGYVAYRGRPASAEGVEAALGRVFT